MSEELNDGDAFKNFMRDRLCTQQLILLRDSENIQAAQVELGEMLKHFSTIIRDMNDKAYARAAKIQKRITQYMEKVEAFEEQNKKHFPSQDTNISEGI